MPNPTYDGSSIFGFAVKMPMTLNPPVEQLNAFFGTNGTQSLFGGLRGRVWLISGVLFGTDLATLNAAEDAYLAYVDGVARVLYDTRGRTWGYVKLKPLEPANPERHILINGDGVWLPYRSAAEGLL